MPDPNKNIVAIVDYGMGNLFSVQYACRAAGLEHIVTADKDVIMNAKGIILPGVGAFGDAMNNLRKFGLVNVLKDCAAAKKPFLGICLGMQLLLGESEEFGTHEGLGLIKGRVVRFDDRHIKDGSFKIPQVGWNRIFFNKKHASVCDRRFSMKNVIDGEYMYFVHSFYVQPQEQDVVLTTTDYEGIHYCSALSKGSILAVQFHPEKSGVEGMKIYKNWAQAIHADKELVGS